MYGEYDETIGYCKDIFDINIFLVDSIKVYRIGPINSIEKYVLVLIMLFENLLLENAS